MQVNNLTKKNTFTRNAVLANNKFTRALGLSHYGGFKDFDGLILHPCAQIHSTGMTFNFDAIFIDKSLTVIKTYENIKPNIVIPRVDDSEYVIELPAYTISHFNIEKNDIIEIV